VAPWTICVLPCSCCNVSYRLRALGVAAYILEVIPIRRGCVESLSRLRTGITIHLKDVVRGYPQTTKMNHGSPSLGGGKESQEEEMGTINRFDSIRIRKKLSSFKHASLSCHGRRNVSKSYEMKNVHSSNSTRDTTSHTHARLSTRSRAMSSLSPHRHNQPLHRPTGSIDRLSSGACLHTKIRQRTLTRMGDIGERWGRGPREV
jgi:hypothetical protein